MCELLWSDPEEIEEWEPNPRGAGIIFGSKLVNRFLSTNKINFIVRAHQLIHEGYKKHFNDKLYTVWSAPNYCYRCGNKEAIMKLDSNLKPDFSTFDASEKDYQPAPEKRSLPEYFL